MDNTGAEPPRFSGSFSTSLLIPTLGIAIAALTLALYHLILVKFWVRRHQSEQTTPRVSRLNSGSQMAAGVDEKLLETIPIISFSSKKVNVLRVDEVECVVCLGELVDGEMVRVLPHCMHVFHVPCIDKWLFGHVNCPVCRSPVVAPVDGPTRVDEGTRVEILRQDDEPGGDVVGDVNISTSEGLLRHCASMVVAREKRNRCLVTGLKRSLSMDQCFLIIDIQKESEIECSSSSSSSNSSSLKIDHMRGRLFRARSIRQLDRLSSNLVRSFSRLRVGRDSGILPY